MRAIGYLRVSSQEQGNSRLGLEAQRAAIEAFALAQGIELLDVVEEVASGGLAPALRPVLAAALAKARKRKAVILVAKLDRLSRDVHAITGLMGGPVRFVVAELGIDVDPFTLHIFAALGQQERRMIGQRTSAALQRKIAAGWQAGNPDLDRHRWKSGVTNAAKADEHAKAVMPTIQPMLDAGESRLAIARKLNAAGVPTARGGEWTSASVGNVLKRAV